MIKLRKLLLCLCFLTIFTGCGNGVQDVGEKIVSPLNNTIPLQGTWKIENCMMDPKPETQGNLNSDWLGKTAQFTGRTVSLGENFWKNVSYKIKRVNAQEYFLYKYKKPLEGLGIKEKEIFVITVSSKDKFLYEFIKLNESRAIAKIEDQFYCLKKVSDRTDVHSDDSTEAESQVEAGSALTEDSLTRSGLLLGLRTPAKGKDSGNPDSLQGYNYRTLWISAVNKESRPVLEANDLFLPRKSGFWKIEVKKVNEAKRTEDILLAYSISDINSAYRFVSSLNPGFWSDREGVLRKKILYVGNDYISVESAGHGKMKNNPVEWQEDRLQVLPVDKIASSKGIKISDVAGENGTIALKTALTELMRTSNSGAAPLADMEKQEESFGLFRKTGHWFFKGRINFKQNIPIAFSDFNINLIPPSELVAYDILHLPWTYLKDKIPQTIDAYTSPNGDIAVVITGKQLLVYSLNGERLSDTPLRSIALQEGDEVVMAEWALGEYMENWEKTFIKNNAAREVVVSR